MLPDRGDVHGPDPRAADSAYPLFVARLKWRTSLWRLAAVNS